MIVEFQKISGGQLPRGGKAFVGVFGNNEPESNPITVYSDFLLTSPIVSSSGIDLDSDGFPLLEGERVNLYVAADYSFMIRDSDGARFWKEARQVSIPKGDGSIAGISDVAGLYESSSAGQVITVNATNDGVEAADAAGFDPTADIDFTGLCTFDTTAQLNGGSWSYSSAARGNLSFSTTTNTTNLDLRTKNKDDEFQFASIVVRSSTVSEEISLIASNNTGNACSILMVSDHPGGTSTAIDSDDVSIKGNLGFDGTVAATTLGTVIARKQVFDENGTPLGFMPIYDSIT